LSRPVLGALVLVTALAGCAQPEWLCTNPEGVRELAVRSAATASRTRPITVDLVSVTDAELAKDLAELPARDYFARRDELARDHPQAVRIESFELAPGRSLGPLPVATPCTPAASLVFASYAGPGEHRARVDGRATATVILGDSSFEVAAP
jgi:type VI secretion system protein